ncbi:MAG: PAS domain-containing protein [Chloroflexi bacterium]|nr:PAS domain-containing protein [Chloroflexota bacterium]MCI0577753.1 PAS domain-containing protein [Chloroflexota bacterium]MCI0644659.1 PAS domain-containing protein [Chloroflexota bacterium]MCI0728043.1 PAS domain-containing protein [Chloroflexota bacterium]
MFPKEIEVILARHLASCLAMPVFLVDVKGNLVFYNEPAEIILGRRFEETGEMLASEWSTIFTPTDENGDPMPAEELPLMIALNERRPAFRRFWIRALDNIPRRLGVTAFPLIGQADRFLGAMAIFWEEAE